MKNEMSKSLEERLRNLQDQLALGEVTLPEFIKIATHELGMDYITAICMAKDIQE